VLDEETPLHAPIRFDVLVRVVRVNNTFPANRNTRLDRPATDIRDVVSPNVHVHTRKIIRIGDFWEVTILIPR
jgi:hypothetical protein